MEKNITYKFDPEKNAWLIQVRGISFEEIIAALCNEGALDILQHPNTQKYAHQKIYVIELKDYAYLVPFVEKGGEIFLKTAFPNRQATKKYLSED